MFDKQLRVPPTLGSDYRTADQWGVAHSIKIHAIQTGSVAIRPNQRQGKGTGVLRLVNTLTDRRWTQTACVSSSARFSQASSLLCSCES